MGQGVVSCKLVVFIWLAGQGEEFGRAGDGAKVAMVASAMVGIDGSKVVVELTLEDLDVVWLGNAINPGEFHMGDVNGGPAGGHGWWLQG